MQSQPQASSQFYRSQDGINLHYLLWPNGNSDSCCLLLHGFTNDAHIWDSLARKLQSKHNVIAIDFRGHGDSDRDEEEKYTHPQLVEDIYQLFQQHNFKSWHLVGHSLGARVAILMLARKQLSVDSFIIIDTGPEVRSVGVSKVRDDAYNTPTAFTDVEAFYQYLSGIYLLGDASRIRAMAEHGLKKDSLGRLIAKTDPAFTRALWQSDSMTGIHKQLRYPLTDELWLALAGITAPCLVMRGQASAILAKDVAKKMADHVIPTAEYIEIRQAGHAIMVDNPAEFEEQVVAFITRCST